MGVSPTCPMGRQRRTAVPAVQNACFQSQAQRAPVGDAHAAGSGDTILSCFAQWWTIAYGVPRTPKTSPTS